jgi:hypothetical protein
MNREIILVLLAELHQFCEKGFLFNPGANQQASSGMVVSSRS